MTVTIQEIIDARQGDTVFLNELEVTIADVLHIEEEDDLIEWYLFYVEDEPFDFDSVIVARIADDEVDIRLCNTVECGWRDELVDNGTQWMFDKPENSEDLVTSELKFTTAIVDDDKNVYYRKMREFYGESDVNFTTVVEYCCYTEVDNPEMCIIQEGEYVTVLRGVNISQDNMEWKDYDCE